MVIVHSLLPAPLHVDVAKLCIQHGASLVTASYTSSQMAQLNDECVFASPFAFARPSH